MGIRVKSPCKSKGATPENVPQGDLPQDVQNLIRRRVVDLSSAHKYYKMVWDAVRPRLEPVVKELGGERYELANGFFQFFMESLCNIMKSPKPNRIDGTGADLIVTALHYAAMHYGLTSKRPTLGPVLLWPDGRPKSEAWRGCGEPRALVTHEVVLEDPGLDREVREPISPDYEFPRICLRLRVNGNRSELPKLTIELEGERTCVLMKGMYYSCDPYDQRNRRNEAKRIWDALLKELRVLVGIGQSYEGRPDDLRPDVAAYLKYFRGLSWSEVAKQHCPKKHTHDSKCMENIRKTVAYFFKRLKQDALSLPRVRPQEKTPEFFPPGKK